jgi:hypothetical protein
MKSTLLILFLLCFHGSVLALNENSKELSIIRSIDDFETPKNYVEVSDEGLPRDHYLKLLQLIDNFKFTVVSETFVRDLFEDLTRDPQVRMSSPGGRCSHRRAYIQKKLKEMSIVSGKILIKCPANDGRLRLQDQVSRRYYSYSNFHDTNIVAIKTNYGTAFRVLDLQFQDTPVSLQSYLTEIEESQRIRPTKRGGPQRGLCYWSVTTPFLTY